MSTWVGVLPPSASAPSSRGLSRSYASGDNLGPVATSATSALVSSTSTEKVVRITYGFDKPVHAANPPAAGFPIALRTGDGTKLPDAACERTTATQVRCTYTLTGADRTRTVVLATVTHNAVQTLDTSIRLGARPMPSVERAIPVSPV